MMLINLTWYSRSKMLKSNLKFDWIEIKKFMVKLKIWFLAPKTSQQLCSIMIQIIPCLKTRGWQKLLVRNSYELTIDQNLHLSVEEDHLRNKFKVTVYRKLIDDSSVKIRLEILNFDNFQKASVSSQLQFDQTIIQSKFDKKHQDF